MTMAEFTAVVDKRIAFRVLIKTAIAIASGSTAVFMLAIGPVIFVNNLSSRVDVVNERSLRQEEQIKGLADTVGKLQIVLAGVVSELKTSRSDQARDLGEIKLILLQRPAASAPPARTANVPIRRTQ